MSEIALLKTKIDKYKLGINNIQSIVYEFLDIGENLSYNNEFYSSLLNSIPAFILCIVDNQITFINDKVRNKFDTDIGSPFDSFLTNIFSKDCISDFLSFVKKTPSDGKMFKANCEDIDNLFVLVSKFSFDESQALVIIAFPNNTLTH